MKLGESLYLRHALADLKKNKGVNVALTVMLLLSAFLMATGAMVMERMFGSVDELFEVAQPPHFLQMHKGEYDLEALERFASEHPEIESWLIEDMLGFDGAAIGWSRESEDASGDLSESLIDNLFVTQNREFDYLVDETGAVPQPSQGEVYAPVAYQQQFDLRSGDELQIRTDAGVHELRIAGFVRDAQMASSLSSSTRFLISDADFEALKLAGGGAPEIIVEYRLGDAAAASDLQRAYESDPALPKNGPGVSGELIRLLHAFGDGLVAVALMFVSLLLIAIALLNARFVIRGTLENEVRQIGAMKAVGMPAKEISRLYLAKYRVMTLSACVLGAVLAVFAANLLTRDVQANYAEAPLTVAAVLAPAAALLFVYVFVLVICRRVLGRVRKIDVVNALVHGSTLDDRQTARRAKRQVRRARRSSLSAYRGGNVDRKLALLDLRAEAGRWVLIPAVFFIAAVLVTLPTNLYTTLQSPRFLTYMGVPECDVRADVQFSEDADAVRDEVLASMRQDDRLTEVQMYSNVVYEVDGEEGRGIFRVEVGDYSGDTVEFLHGRAPEDGQIALSVMNAEEHQAFVGDELTLYEGDESITVEVSGIYQDITSGGLTAKMHGDVPAGATAYVIFADARDGVDPAAVAEEYQGEFPAAAVTPMHEFARQTLSGITDAFLNAVIVSLVFGAGVALLITSLFLKLRLTNERRKMGMLSSLGFSTNEIIAQVRLKSMIAIVLGTILGVGFAAVAGESVVGGLISTAGLGIVDLSFIPNPLLVYAACPLILIGAGYLGATILTSRLRGEDKSTWLIG